MRSAILRALAALAIVTTFGLAPAGAQTGQMFGELVGKVTDDSGGALPGVTVTAVHEATGNTFTAVTDERGEFRLPVRVGNYRITAELSGFTTVSRNLQILIGQTTEVDVQMTPSSVQETITVTGETPIVITRFARLRNLLMNARRSSVRNCVHSSRQRTGVRCCTGAAIGVTAVRSVSLRMLTLRMS